MDTLDRNDLERDLVMTLYDYKEDIEKQMLVSEELTNAHKGNRKSVLELEIGRWPAGTHKRSQGQQEVCTGVRDR